MRPLAANLAAQPSGRAANAGASLWRRSALQRVAMDRVASRPSIAICTRFLARAVEPTEAAASPPGQWGGTMRRTLICLSGATLLAATLTAGANAADYHTYEKAVFSDRTLEIGPYVQVNVDCSSKGGAPRSEFSTGLPQVRSGATRKRPPRNSSATLNIAPAAVCPDRSSSIGRMSVSRVRMSCNSMWSLPPAPS